ncbi:hypothetical protein [Ruegeria sp. PrR005]|uniref:Calcium-binding protein n=1 Tax=Ruegeria sp. PrR005 TaxID=2706882 RepID=A0A6B2NRG5_9RHOB|nr:hypothetical protein [Ruegeria sp. PrR005]NDW45099.1 hypothetical protein [Ruegeria sp. PrR005]
MPKRLFFIADDGATGREPYVTDGTTIQSLGDINPGAAGSNPGGSNIGHALSFGNSVLFVADDGVYGAEFWTTDGTPEGTRLLVDFVPGELQPDIRGPVLAGGRVWFNGGTPETGLELHVTDGTAAGTRLVADLNAGAGDTGTSGYTEVNGHVVFRAYLPPVGESLWVTDGTSGGTRMLAAIGNHPGEGAILNDVLYFMGDDPATGNELWRTNGTEDRTFLVVDIFPGDRSSFPQDLVTVGNHVLFTARDDEHGTELWASDGTGAGTFMVRDINPGLSGSLMSPFGQLPDRVVFTANDGDGRGLWVSDGTFGGTTRIGTMDGNVQFPNFAPVGDGSRLVFRTRDALWVTDGTSGGTERIASGLDVSGGEFNAPTPVGPHVYFAADDGVHGNELWITDGTAEGTRMIQDMTPGAGDTPLDRFTVLDTGDTPPPAGFIEATEAEEVHDLGAPGVTGVRGRPADLADDRLTNWDLTGNSSAIILLGYIYGPSERPDLLASLLVTLVSSASLSLDTNLDGAFDTEITFEGDFSGVDLHFTVEDGNTTITTVPGAALTPLTLVGDADGNLLSGRDGNDTVRGLDGADRVLGNGGHDSLDGGLGADTLNGGDGDDTIIGGPGEGDLRDVIFAGEGNDSVDAGAGNDQIFGQGGNDTIAGGFGVDDLQGQDGNDVITGSAFSDLVFGGAGDDFVNGGFGHDRINGGTGADKFFHVGASGHGSDWVQDYSSAEGDVLLFGIGSATRDQFQVNFAHTENAEGERAGDDAVQEAFVIYRPTGQIMWALVDGEGQSSINLQIGVDVYDLLA